MTTWNSAPGYYPPQDPNQGYYAGQPGGYPPQAPYASAPPAGGYPPQGGYPGPQQGYPGGYPPGAPPPGFTPPPSYDTGYNNPTQQPGMYGASYDPEADVKNFDFSDRTIRHGFIRKVYAILMVQLSISLGFIALFFFHEPTKKFARAHFELWIIAFVVLLVTMIAMACCGSVRRKAPINFIFLGLFTVAESFLLAMSASYYQSVEVLMAIGITTAVCLALTLFAFQTKWDFTMMGGVLLVATVIFLLFGIIMIFVKVKIMSLIYASLGALLFSVYLIYDTQLMMGGKHKYSISPEEYIFAALNLYLDVINIFMYILAIIGTSRD